MPAALRPPDDDVRVAALRSYRLLDTLPEREYDDLVRLAAAICGTPVAAMSLVDEDRQWFKAKVGLDLPQTGRDVSFCAHAILEPEHVLEVPDATADERFADNPLVTRDGGIRFYAGMPLVTRDAVALGALCVIDSRPRRLTDDQRDSLEILGRQVVAQVELRRVLADLSDSERRAREGEQRYRHLSAHDPLTGLANRGRFEELLGLQGNAAFGVVYVDLDGFKPVNDRLGHAAGDAVLVHVAAALRSVTGPGDTVARVGGDEFALLVPAADDRRLRRLVSRIARAVEKPVEVLPGRRVTVGCSAGSVVRAPGEDVEAALRRADAAMYEVKTAGRRSGRAQAPAEELAEQLRAALERDELELHYQPIVELSSGADRVVGAEALVRWRHPERGLLLPGDFVPDAERTGVIHDLGERVLCLALQQLRRWEDERLLSGEFRLHVNVAAQQLHNAAGWSSVLELLADAAVTPDRLCLEVTESSLLDATRFTADAAAELVGLGVHLALDDFGTGFSSLGQLRSFPFSAVKIDRSFVRGLGDVPQDDAVVEAVIALAHRLGMTVVAEGVEAPRQAELLRALGCGQAQGWLFGRAVSADRLTDLLRTDDAPRAQADGSVRLPVPRSARAAQDVQA